MYALYYSNFFARGMNKFGKGVVNVMTVGGRFLSYCGGKIASAMAWLSKVPLVRNLVGYIREVREDLRRKFLPMMEESECNIGGGVSGSPKFFKKISPAYRSNPIF